MLHYIVVVLNGDHKFICCHSLMKSWIILTSDLFAEQSLIDSNKRCDWTI